MCSIPVLFLLLRKESMAIYIDIPNFDEIFEAFEASEGVILLNDVPYVTEEDKVLFQSLIVTETESDVLSSVPKCRCGKYQNAYNAGDGTTPGRICEVCNTEVQYPAEETIDSKVWIRVPDGVEGFISPYFWNKLTTLAASTKGLNILRWAIDPKVAVPSNAGEVVKEKITYLTNCNWVRSLNYFINNWEVFFEMIQSTTPRAKRSAVKSDLDILRGYSKLFFPKYLPLPTKALMIIEKTNVGNYADTVTMSSAMAAAKTIGVINAPRGPSAKPFSIKRLEIATVDICQNLTGYCQVAFKTNICGKSGYLRGNGYKARCDWTARGVVTSIHTPHDYAELHLPWVQGVELFKIHLYNKLIKKHNFTHRATILKLKQAVNVYDPLIDTLFKELIASGKILDRKITCDMDFYISRGLTKEQVETITLPKVGIPVMFQRNPTLGMGSAQLQALTRIKTDLSDKSVSLSDLVATAYNMDHDGDAMNLTLLLQPRFVEASEPMDIRYVIHDTVKLGKLNDNVKLPDPACMTLGNFVNQRYHENLKSH
jgi:hypothetical protein